MPTSARLPLAPLVMAGGDAEFQELADSLGNSSVPPRTANAFFPGDLATCGAAVWERTAVSAWPRPRG